LAALEAHTVADVLDLRNFAPSGYYFRTTPTNIDGNGQYNTTQSVIITGSTTGKGFSTNDGTVTGVLVSSALLTNSVALGTSSNHPLAFITNNSLRGSISNAGVWNIGVAGTLTGQMGFSGSTSGTATITAQATAGTPTLTLPNTSGTLAAGVANDTNVTLSLSATTGVITAGWSGTLAASRGGTGLSALGTGVATALGINVGSAGAFVTFDGALGTPSSGTLTNATGLPISTGVSGLGTNVATFLATPSSANLLAALTDETGTGSAVFGTSPTLTTPAITTSSTLNNNLAANTSGDGFVLTNTTAATAGNQSHSPRIHWTGQGWKTDATAASQTLDWTAELIPVQGAANPQSFLTFKSQVNGGGYNTIFQVIDNGVGASTFSARGSSAAQVVANVNGTNTGTIYADASQVIEGAIANIPLRLISNNTNGLELSALGSVVLGRQSALATNATDGFAYIPTCAGTPTGTPTAYTGKVAMVFDTTNNKLYIYDGGWLGGTTPGAFT
jgi:hypothetical protein